MVVTAKEQFETKVLIYPSPVEKQKTPKQLIHLPWQGEKIYTAYLSPLTRRESTAYLSFLISLGKVEKHKQLIYPSLSPLAK